MKVRRVDFYPDDWLAGTTGMPGREKSVYWDICALIYSRGGPIPDDEQWLSRVCGYHWRELRAIKANLIKSGKIVSKDGHVWVKRCSEELQRAFKRSSQASQNGLKGGRPSHEINGLDEAGGSRDQKTINQQSTINNQHIESSNDDSKPIKVRRTRLPENFVPPEEWFTAAGDALARHQFPPQNLPLLWERFFNWTQSGSPNAVKTNWRRAWINWCLNAGSGGNVNGKQPTARDTTFWAALEASRAFGQRELARSEANEPLLD